jgi:3-hydroxybutyryl-CoA dehydrogenase
MDLTGIPAYAAVMKRLWPKLSCATEVPARMRELIESGAKGISNGRGFYDYTPEQAKQWERRLTENVWKVRRTINELFEEQPQ